MNIIHKIIEIQTDSGIQVYDITLDVQNFIKIASIQQGQVLIFSRHTTTALTINEYEPRLIEDTKIYLKALAPEGGLILGKQPHRYLHNDLHLRPDIPPDEPMNAHSHLMAMTLGTSEVIPIVDGILALGTYQSILFFELDGPRMRSLFLQAIGL